MTDVVEMLRAGVRKDDERREQIRRGFPLCTDAIDAFRAEFGPGVKAKFFSESGKTMGKPVPFEGTDVDQILRLVDADAKRAGK